MAKTTNPIQSIEASGSLEGLLTFSSSKGRSYAKKFASPKQPQTANQKLQRIGFAMASKIAKDWPELIDEFWGEEAEREQKTPRNAYIGAATVKFTNGLSVSPQKTPIWSAMPRSTITMAATVNADSITWSWATTETIPIYGWLLAVGLSSSAINQIPSVVHAAGSEMSWTQKGLERGVTYYAKAFGMVNGARWYRAGAAATAVIPS